VIFYSLQTVLINGTTKICVVCVCVCVIEQT